MMSAEEYRKIKDEGEKYRLGCGTMMFVIIAMCFLLSSCATKSKIEYVDREVVKYVHSVQHDTLINNVHDSIYHTIFQKGDTVYDTKYVEKTVYKDRIVHHTDTVLRDSIHTEIKEVTVVKKETPKWCYYVSVAFGLFIIIKIFKFARWLRMR